MHCKTKLFQSPTTALRTLAMEESVVTAQAASPVSAPEV